MTVPTTSHWGAYQVRRCDDGSVAVLPHPDDPDPSPLLGNVPGSLTHPTRVTAPAVRRGWLDDGPGPSDRRGAEEFVEVGWDEALDRLAAELTRVRERYGNEAVYGGSYGWASAGRFHHAQSQLHRFLAMFGGCTGSRNSYSLGTSLVLLPHLVGDADAVLRSASSWQTIQDATELIVAFGGTPASDITALARRMAVSRTLVGTFCAPESTPHRTTSSPPPPAVGHSPASPRAAEAPTMTEPVTLPAVHSWLPPAELNQRGTVVLFPGRGEHGGVYERLGHRLSADGYVVHAADSTPGDDLDVLTRLVAETTATATAPVVLAGSDTGALQALALATVAPGRPPAGVILAGIAGPGTPVERSWDEELEARTACPTHRRRLTEDGRFVRGALSGPLPDDLLAAEIPLDRIELPVLLLHGDADPVTAPAIARSIAARLPGTELGVVRGGRHDILNDLDHRSVAAHVVQWLERLRSGPDHAPVVVVETLN